MERNGKDPEVIILPDIRRLKEKTEELRTVLAEKAAEYDELRLVICANIETVYLMHFGALEYKVYEAQFAAMRMKRKCEMIQAKKNRQEDPVISDIELMLDMEFEAYRSHLQEQIGKINAALEHSSAEKLSEDDAAELKERYRMIVKSLHPDINKDATPAQLEMFSNACEAYRNGDLAAIRLISELSGCSSFVVRHGSVMSELKKEEERLRGLIDSIDEKTAKLKSEYPYNVKDLISDSERIIQEKEKLGKILKEYESMKDIYDSRIEELLR